MPDAELKPRVERLSEMAAAAELAVRQAVLAFGRSHYHRRVKATYYRPAVTFDNKGLQEYVATHPEIERFKKVGQPRVALKYYTAGENELPPADGPESLPEADD